MRRSRALFAAAAAAAALAVPTAAQARVREIEPVTGFRRQLAGIKRHTSVPVLWPDRIAIDVPRRHGVEATWRAGRGGWELAIGIGPRCGGANACFVGELSAQRGGEPAFRRTVRLHGGVRGYYKPTSCGASCSPPQLQWKVRRVLYSIQFRAAGRGGDRAKLVAMADSALKAGPR
jgi:hypothetical protein